MKIQCNVCEAAEAKVLCCADEAALCLECDKKVHAANKLASKHQRVPLSNSSSQMPKCDICQDTVGFFFCLEDRALLCRKCDVAIHTANNFVSNHQRFLLTGVKVSPESDSSSSMPKPSSGQSNIDTPTMLAGDPNDALPLNDGVGDFPSTKVPFSGGSAAGSISQWQMDDFFGLNEYNQSYSFMENGSAKADSGKRSDSDNSSMLRSAEEDLEDDDCLGQVPENSWAVPQVPSPPTSSGLHWPKHHRNLSDSAAFVPDLCFSTAQSSRHDQHITKRRRQF